MERERPAELTDNPERIDGVDEDSEVESLPEEELAIRIAAQLDIDPLSLSVETASTIAESYLATQQAERALTTDELARLYDRLHPNRSAETEEPSTSTVADSKKAL